MPADERATLTHEQIADRVVNVVTEEFGDECFIGACYAPGESLRAEIVAVLKEADRLAREDAAKALRLYGQHALSCPAAPGSLQPLDVCQCGLDAAIRASITTDEGVR